MYRNIRVEAVDLLQKMRQIKQNAEDVILSLEDLLMQTTQPTQMDYDPDEYLVREVFGMEAVNCASRKVAEAYSSKDIIRDF